jgi:hypothetical protein
MQPIIYTLCTLPSLVKGVCFAAGIILGMIITAKGVELFLRDTLIDLPFMNGLRGGNNILIPTRPIGAVLASLGVLLIGGSFTLLVVLAGRACQPA